MQYLSRPLTTLNFKVPMNIVLLKNVSIVGLHWGAYSSRCFQSMSHHGRFIVHSENEVTRIPKVWKAVLE